MNLENFAVTHSQMYTELLKISVNANSITKDSLITFCQHLTDYLAHDVLSLKPPPLFIVQALDFCTIYGEGVVGNITDLKTALGEVYVYMAYRLAETRVYLDKQLFAEQRPSKRATAP